MSWDSSVRLNVCPGPVPEHIVLVGDVSHAESVLAKWSTKPSECPSSCVATLCRSKEPEGGVPDPTYQFVLALNLMAERTILPDDVHVYSVPSAVPARSPVRSQTVFPPADPPILQAPPVQNSSGREMPWFKLTLGVTEETFHTLSER